MQTAGVSSLCQVISIISVLTINGLFRLIIVKVRTLISLNITQVSTLNNASVNDLFKVSTQILDKVKTIQLKSLQSALHPHCTVHSLHFLLTIKISSRLIPATNSSIEL